MQRHEDENFSDLDDSDMEDDGDDSSSSCSSSSSSIGEHPYYYYNNADDDDNDEGASRLHRRQRGRPGVHARQGIAESEPRMLNARPALSASSAGVHAMHAGSESPCTPPSAQPAPTLRRRRGNSSPPPVMRCWQEAPEEPASELMFEQALQRGKQHSQQSARGLTRSSAMRAPSATASHPQQWTLHH